MYTKTCAMCGRTFETKYKKAMFCKGPHYMTCPVCGNTFQVDNRIAYCYHNRDKVCCSRTCGLKLGFSKQTTEQKKAKSDKAKRTKLERYGDENYNNPNKFKETNLKRYGVENPMLSADIRSKAEQTKVERYGSTTYNNRQKAAETCMQRYGVDNAAKSERHIGDFGELRLTKARYSALSVIASSSFVARIRAELGAPDATVVGTGGLARTVARATDVFDAIDPDLTLRGIREIWLWERGRA